MPAQTWIEKRASELATAKEEEGKRLGQMVTLDWTKLFFVALAEYLDACGLEPKNDL